MNYSFQFQRIYALVLNLINTLEYDKWMILCSFKIALLHLNVPPLVFFLYYLESFWHLELLNGNIHCLILELIIPFHDLPSIITCKPVNRKLLYLVDFLTPREIKDLEEEQIIASGQSFRLSYAVWFPKTPVHYSRVLITREDAYRFRVLSNHPERIKIPF